MLALVGPHTMTFNLIDIFVKVFNDLFSYVDINHKFMCEIPASSLNSTEEVNTLVGISGEMEGNIMFGYTEKTAREIAQKLSGADVPTKDIDIFVKSALADFYSEFCKRVTYAIKVESVCNTEQDIKDYTLFSSNPTYVSGSSMYGMISKVPSKKLFFKVNGEKFGIAYNLEQK